MSYKVKLDIFEGPLDLLLYIIKKSEVDIFDIPIAKITQQYLEYLEFMELLDLNIAGEFLVMAAELMRIKSKMLLPPDETEAEEEDLMEDPRAELVKRLLEYKKFKEAATDLRDLQLKQGDIFKRTPQLEDAGPEEAPYFEASIFDLLNAFSKALKDMPRELFQEIIRDEFTVEQKIHDLYHMLVEKPRITLSELFAQAKNRLDIISTFLAVLELIRLHEIIVVQRQLFGEIEIVRNTENVKAHQ
ncbi:MAG: segregation/condensation protein A [Candidatus Omnitrophota bacterium]